MEDRALLMDEMNKQIEYVVQNYNGLECETMIAMIYLYYANIKV